MDDLISRQAVMDEISKQQTYKMFEGEDTLYIDANDVGSVIASMPSAHPKIIRCRECKFLRFTGTVWRCQNRLVMMLCEPNDYCSRAERKE